MSTCSKCQRKAQEAASCVGDDCLRYGIKSLVENRVKAKKMNIQLDSFGNIPKVLVRYKARQPRDVRNQKGKRVLGFWRYGEVGFIPFEDFKELKVLFELAPSTFWAEYGIVANNPAVAAPVEDGAEPVKAVKQVPVRAQTGRGLPGLGVPLPTEVKEFHDEGEFSNFDEDAFGDEGSDEQLTLAELDEQGLLPDSETEVPKSRRAGKAKG